MNTMNTMNTQLKTLDRVGFIASFGCAIHCALLPLVIAFLPALGIAWLASSAFGIGMLLFTATVASIAIYKGFRTHNRCWPIGFFGFGLAFLLFSETIMEHSHSHSHESHYMLSFTGGIMIAIAHVLNHYFHKSCHAPEPCNDICCHKE